MELDPSRRRTALVYGLLATALTLGGIGVSIYLTIAHYNTKVTLACPDTGLINCEKVTTSSYSMQFGIPLAVLGLAFFAVTLLLQNPWAWRSSSRLLRRARLAVAGGSALMVLWLIWVELFRLDAICLYCTSVHALSIILFILTVLGTAATAPLPDFGDDDEEDEDPDDPAPVSAGTEQPLTV
jgi:uncharacterized membrane protein